MDRDWCVIIDTAHPIAKIIVVRGDRIVVRQWEADFTLSRRLLVELDEALREAAVSWPAVKRIAVHNGPGNSSAVRTGVVVGEMLALAKGAELVAVQGETVPALVAAAGAAQPTVAIQPHYT